MSDDKLYEMHPKNQANFRLSLLASFLMLLLPLDQLAVRKHME